MKKIIKFLSLGILIIVVGCDNFLSEVPTDSLTANNFYDTESDFEYAVNSAYTNLQVLYGDHTNYFNGSYWIFSEMRSDNSTFEKNETDQSSYPFNNLDMFTMQTSNAISTSCWNYTYTGIGKCNNVLYYIEDKDFDSKNRFIGEVKFLRALYYFHLVQYYGDVPLCTTKVESYADAFANDRRVSSDSIYAQIIEDLTFAKENLPSSYSSSEFGRATEGAARTLLADVYMWQKNYTGAITELEKVQTLGYNLVPNYADVFDINNEQNSEVVFSVQYINGNSGLGSFFMYRFLPWDSGREFLTKDQYTARTGLNIPTTDLLNSFETGDLRKNMINTDYTDTYGTNIPYTTKFMDTDFSLRGVTGNDFPVYRYAKVLLMLAECDFREGSESTALSLVNQIRNRAGSSDLTSVTLDDIINERRLEFFCEADRWDVLVRTGKAKEVIAAHGIRQKAERPVAVDADAYVTIKLLFPIPDDVIVLNPSIEQN